MSLGSSFHNLTTLTKMNVTVKSCWFVLMICSLKMWLLREKSLVIVTMTEILHNSSIFPWPWIIDHFLTCEDPVIVLRMIYSTTKATDTFQESSLGILHIFKPLKILRWEGLELNHDKHYNQLIPFFIPTSSLWLKLGKSTTKSSLRKGCCVGMITVGKRVQNLHFLWHLKILSRLHESEASATFQNLQISR